MTPRYVTTQQAAEHAGVPEQTIRNWARRGHLTKVARVGRHAMYDLAAVYAAERMTRPRRGKRLSADTPLAMWHSS